MAYNLEISKSLKPSKSRFSIRKRHNSQAGQPVSSDHFKSQPYKRQRDLPRLLALWPNELRSLTKERLRTIVTKLAKALRVERQKGKSSHWSYDMNRHLALLHAYRAENKALQEFDNA